MSRKGTSPLKKFNGSRSAIDGNLNRWWRMFPWWKRTPAQRAV